MDLPVEASGAQHGSEFGRKDFHDDLAAEGNLFGQKNAAHSAAAQFALEALRPSEARTDFV